MANVLQNIKEGVEGKPVEWYSEVFDIVFPNIDRETASMRWSSQLQKPRDEDSEKGKRTDE
jgi:ATP-dependent Lon protease